MRDIHHRPASGKLCAFQIALTNVAPSGFKQSAPAASAGSIGGITGTLNQNTVFNFAGKFEQLTINPNLTDSLTAKLVLSMATMMFGPATY